MSYYSKLFDGIKVTLGEEDDEFLLTVILDRQENANALDLPMIESLCEVLEHADTDPKVRVILLTGAGKFFCAGGNVKQMKERTGMFAGDSNQLRERYERGIQKIPRLMEGLQTPVIGVINGAAIGAGCDLAAMCDLRVGSMKAKFGETFSKLNLVPGDGGPYFLTRVIGYAKACEMYLTANIYDAEAAFEMGLLNHLYGEDSLQMEARAFARKIARNGPAAVAMTKKVLKRAGRLELESQLDLLAAYQAIAQRMTDHDVGLEALKNGHPPHFEQH